MNGTNRRAKRIGLTFCGALLGVLTGCMVYQGQPRYGGAYYEQAVQADAAYAEIRSESDFYEPLSPYGRWEFIGSFGRCWIPGGVEAGWSPYSNGYWQPTDAGWYWASDEPWGWATYHYGRWDLSPQFGWYWVPQTQWAPAWVSWRQGGGYVGWAPLGSSMRAGERGGPAHGYVLVEERRFLEPVRSRREPVNNTFFNRTVEITRTHTVNRAEVNEGPGAAGIEQASGRRIPAATVRELRTRDEAKVSIRHQTPVLTRPQTLPGPTRIEPPPPERKVVPVHEPRQIEKPAVNTAEPHLPAIKREVPQPENRRIAKPATEPHAPVSKKEDQPADQVRVTQPAGEKRVQQQTEGPKVAPIPASSNPKPDIERRTANQGQNQPKAAGKHPEQPAKHIEESNQNAQPVSEQHAKPEPAPSDQNRTNAARDDRIQRNEN